MTRYYRSRHESILRSSAGLLQEAEQYVRAATILERDIRQSSEGISLYYCVDFYDLHQYLELHSGRAPALKEEPSVAIRDYSLLWQFHQAPVKFVVLPGYHKELKGKVLRLLRPDLRRYKSTGHGEYHQSLLERMEEALLGARGKLQGISADFEQIMQAPTDKDKAAISIDQCRAAVSAIVDEFSALARTAAYYMRFVSLGNNGRCISLVRMLNDVDSTSLRGVRLQESTVYQESLGYLSRKRPDRPQSNVVDAEAISLALCLTEAAEGRAVAVAYSSRAELMADLIRHLRDLGIVHWGDGCLLERDDSYWALWVAMALRSHTGAYNLDWVGEIRSELALLIDEYESLAFRVEAAMRFLRTRPEDWYLRHFGQQVEAVVRRIDRVMSKALQPVLDLRYAAAAVEDAFAGPLERMHAYDRIMERMERLGLTVSSMGASEMGREIHDVLGFLDNVLDKIDAARGGAWYRDEALGFEGRVCDGSRLNIAVARAAGLVICSIVPPRREAFGSLFSNAEGLHPGDRAALGAVECILRGDHAGAESVIRAHGEYADDLLLTGLLVRAGLGVSPEASLPGGWIAEVIKEERVPRGWLEEWLYWLLQGYMADLAETELGKELEQSAYDCFLRAIRLLNNSPVPILEDVAWEAAYGCLMWASREGVIAAQGGRLRCFYEAEDVLARHVSGRGEREALFAEVLGALREKLGDG